MNKDLAAQFLSAIISRNSGQHIEDDVKEALAYAETFERLTADYTTPQAVQELIQSPIGQYTLRFNDNVYEEYKSLEARNLSLFKLLELHPSYKYLISANNRILVEFSDEKRLFFNYANEKDLQVFTCRDDDEGVERISSYYEERGGFAKHIEYLNSISRRSKENSLTTALGESWGVNTK